MTNDITITIHATDHEIRKSRSGRGGNSQNCKASPVVNMRKPCKVATWNVRSLYQAGKIHNAAKEMERLNIDILGISDVQWPDSGKMKINNKTIYYSGSQDGSHSYGVGIILNQNIDKAVVNFIPHSNRIILLQLNQNKPKINIIQVYAPTADKPESDIETFYEDLDNILKSIKTQDVTIIMGDFNAKVGDEKVEECTGGYGLGNRNERGDRLIEFCQNNNFVITNTLFKMPKRRLYTWKSPADQEGRIVRNQIDYILIRQRYKNAIISAKTYPSADIGSDHNPVVTKIRLKMKIIKRRTTNVRIDTSKLRDPAIKQRLIEEINNRLTNVKEQIRQNTETETKWLLIKTEIDKSQKEILTPTRYKNKQWMTEEILDLMEERRQHKNKDNQMYKRVDKQIKSKIKQAKEQWLKEQCAEIEEYQKRYDSFNAHKKIKELTQNNRKRKPGILRDTNGKLVLSTNEKLKRWTEYINELFKDNRAEQMEIEVEDDMVLKILKEEIKSALKNSKNGKAVGPDQIPVESLKCINDETLDIIVDLFNTVYKTGNIPKQWLLSTFCAIPKNTNAKDCSEHRTISLISHILKLFLKIIHGRINKKLEEGIDDSQFGFRNGLGTREALFAFNVLAQRCMDMNVDVHVCYIDFEKAFDKVRHEKLVQILKTKNIDKRDLRIITNLYWNQRAQIVIDNEPSTEIEIRRGVRQGCIMSPLLFNVYSEAIFEEALISQSEGIIINGKTINNIRYADDTVIMASSAEQLQLLLNKTNSFCEEYGLKMNIKKTKYMIITKKTNIQTSIHLGDVPIERVYKYKYLGTWISEKNDQTTEIKTRIEMARNAFVKMKTVLSSKDLTLELRVRALRCYVFSILQYGLESWTLKQDHINKLQSFEMWCYRRMLKIAWTQKKTNTEVLREMGKECEMVNTIKMRKLQYLGHVMRGQRYEMLRLIIQGKIRGGRSIGRRRVSWLKNLRDWFKCSSIELFRAAVDRVKIVMMISNLRLGDGT